MASNWVMFFDEFGSDLHPTFKRELSLQLLEKGDKTGIKQFQKYSFQLIVGMQPMNIKEIDGKILATIDFVTPTSWSLQTTISWFSKSDCNDLQSIHKKEVQSNSIEFNWENDFPIDKVKTHITPRRKTKAAKNGFGFDAEYFYLSIPVVELEIFFSSKPTLDNIISMNSLLEEFINTQNKKGKEIQFISKLIETDYYFSVIMDLGLKSTVRTVNQLLKFIGEDHSQLIEKVRIR